MYKVNKFNGNFNVIGSNIKKIRKQNKITRWRIRKKYVLVCKKYIRK